MKVPGPGSDPIGAALRMAARSELHARPEEGLRGSSGIESARAPEGVVDVRLRDATVALEGVFARELVRALRGTVPGGGSPDAPGGELYTSLMDDHLADVLAGDDGLGLSRIMLKQLMRPADPVPGGS